ncbi:Ig-like domain-containing protein [Stenotrophomonas humi]
MTVIVSVVADKSITSSKELGGAKAGKPIRIKAIKNGKYLLAENESGIAPENITVKRVGKNLHVALEGRDPDQPELIIEEFFSNEGQLVGLAEDGAYHEYIAVDGNGDSDVAFLLEGASSPLALGSSELLGFADGLVVAGAGILPWMLAGLGLVGAGVAIDRHNDDDRKPVVDTTPPENNGIGQIVDDKGPVQGNIEKGGITDDDRPTLGGKGQEPGDTVTIIDNGKVIGEVIVDKDGGWSFTPEKELDDGEHSFEVVITDPNGNTSGPSDDFTVIIDTTPPTKPGANDAQLIDDAGAIVGPIVSGSTTDDNTPTYNGKAEPNATVVVYDNGKEIGRAQTNGVGEWTFTPSKPLVDGDHSLNYQVIDKAGNVGEKSDVIDFTVDTVAPTTPGANDAQLIDDAGAIVGPIVSGSTTDDNTPTYNGKAEPNATVVIYDSGKEIGRAQTNGAGDWTFTPSTPLTDGPHSLNYQVIDKAGNVGEKSDVIDFIVDTVAPTTPGANDAQLIDDAGAIVGPIVSGSTTDDSTPTYNGKAEPNATVVVYDNGKEIGRAQTNGAGEWTFTPSTPLVDGDHSLNYQVIDKAGNVGEKSDVIDFIVDTVAPTTPGANDAQLIDDAGAVVGPIVSGSTTDDNTPTYNGKAEPNATVVIYDNGKEIGRAQTNGAGDWTFTPSTPLTDGPHSLNYQVIDKAGNVGEKSDVIDFAVDTTAPAKPTIDSVYDDQGNQTGELASGDSTDDATPTISGSAEPGSTVVIYDNGKKIGQAEVGADGKWTFEPKLPLGLGDHKLTVEAVDAAGNTSVPSDAFDLTLGNADKPNPPAITGVIDDVGSVTGSIQKNGVTDDARPTIEGTAQAGMTVSVYIDGKLAGTEPVDAEGNWSFTPSADLADGPHYINATSTNSLGNVSPETGDYPFVVDTVAPSKPGSGDAELVDDEGNITGPITNGTITDDSTPTFNGKAEPDSTVVIYDNGKEIGKVPTDENGNWTFTPNKPLGDGDHSLSYEVVDEAGNVSDKSDPIGFKVDTTDVQISIDGATDNVGSLTGAISNGGVTDDATPTLHGKATAGGIVKIYEGSVLLGEVTANAEGKWSLELPNGLSEGAHSLTATVTTDTSAEGAPTPAFNLTVDLSAPDKPSITEVGDDVGSIQGPIANGASTDDTTPTLKGQAEANSTVHIHDNGKLIGSVQADNNGLWSFTPTTPLNGGSHDFTVTSEDKAGNVSVPSDVHGVVVDTVAPAKPTIDSVYDDQGNQTGELTSGDSTDDATPTISGSAEPGSTVVIYDNGKKIGQAEVGADGKWTFEPKLPLGLGDHKLTVEAVDAAGNTSVPSDAFDLTLGNADKPNPPAITGVIDDVGSVTGSIQKNGVTDDARPTIEGTAQAGMTVSVYIDGKLAGTAPVDAEGNWSFTPSADLADGPHYINATSTNSLGNVSPETGDYPFVVDTVAPSKPGSGDAELVDDEGNITGPITNGTITDDSTPTFNGKAEPDSTVVIYDNGKEIGKVPTDENGNWTFTPNKPLGDGDHSLSYEVVDEAGNVSDKSDPIGFKVDTTDVQISIDGATDNVGSLTGAISNGGVTDDATPTLHGKATAGGIVKIYEGSVLLGEAIANAEGKWSLELPNGLSEGAHSLTATVTTDTSAEGAPTPAFNLTVDLSAPDKPSITEVGDDVGSIQGPIANGASTDDTTPTLKGQAEANSTVHIHDNGKLIGSVQADNNGLWSFTPTTPLNGGSHDFTVTSEDKAGNVSVPSDVHGVVVDTVAPAKPAIDTVQDDQGSQTGNLASGDSTDDTKPTINGSGEPNSTVVIYDDGKKIGEAEVGADGKWTFEPSEPLLDGTHELTVVNVDSAGNESAPSDVFTLITDTVSPVKPQITAVTDNEGAKQGQLVSGEVTDDLLPEISGKAEANSIVIIWDNGLKLGQAQADANGDWTFVPTAPLQLGLHAVHVTAVDAAGNESEPSDAFDFSINRELPTAPSITHVADDVGQFTGFVQNGRYTDDAMPTINGRGVAGEKIEIRVDGELIGSTYVGEDGRWKYTVETALDDGMRTITAVSVSAAGIPSEVSNAFQINLDTKAPDAPSIESVMDNVGASQGELSDGEYTDDRRPTFNGKAEVGASIIVYDNGEEVGDAWADANGNWTWTPNFNLAYGEHEFTFEPFDTAGNIGKAEHWTLIVGDITRGAPQAENPGESLSIQDLLVNGDVELLIEGTDPHSVQTEAVDLDAHIAGDWLQSVDSFNGTSSNGFTPIVPVVQDSMQQLDNPLVA